LARSEKTAGTETLARRQQPLPLLVKNKKFVIPSTARDLLLEPYPVFDPLQDLESSQRAPIPSVLFSGVGGFVEDRDFHTAVSVLQIFAASPFFALNSYHAIQSILVSR